jgi:hypothetical protein
MPKFQAEDYVYIDLKVDVEEFLDKCSISEIEDLVETLKSEYGYSISKSDSLSVNEAHFEESLNKLLEK